MTPHSFQTHARAWKLTLGRLVGHRLARVAIEDAMVYAQKRKVFGKRLIDSEVIRNKVTNSHWSALYIHWLTLARASVREHGPPRRIPAGVRPSFPHADAHKLMVSTCRWIESIVYAVKNLSHDEANARLGGTTALLKANCSLVLEIVAREAVQILGGIGHTRGEIQPLRREDES